MTWLSILSPEQYVRAFHGVTPNQAWRIVGFCEKPSDFWNIVVDIQA